MKFGKLVGAIDEGTTSARFILFKAGTDEIVCFHQINVPSIYQQEGWVEQEPFVIWNVVVDCMKETLVKLERLGGKAEDVVAIGVTNQRETTVVWDRKTGKPLYNAIIWMDNRTSSTVDDLIAQLPSNRRDINYLKPLCGLPISPYFSALKLRWLRDNVPSVKKAMDEGTCQFGNIDTWVVYNLTGGARGGKHVTDVTNASRTMLMNINEATWDPQLMSFFGIPANMLPEIRSSAEHYGNVEISTLKGVPITSILGDQQAALVGQQCLLHGQAKSTYGTGCFLLYNTGTAPVQSTHGLLTTTAYQLGPEAPLVYALEGSVAIAGAAISWMRDNLGLFESVAEVESMASKVDSSLDVYFVPAFSGLYAPYWNQEARGAICGLSEDTTSEHIVRATLESICFQVRDILDAMRKDCGIPLTKLMVDGGMTVNKLFLQLQADLVGISVVPANLAETTALGVALAAYTVVEPTFTMDGQKSGGLMRLYYKPKIGNYERDMRYRKWKMAVERCMNWDTPTFSEGLDYQDD